MFKDNVDKAVELVKEKYGELTGEEISQIKEKPEQLLDLVQEKFGVAKEEATEFFQEKMGSLDGLRDKAEDATRDASEKAGGFVENVKDKIGDVFGK